MSEYLAPGVFIEEVSFRSKTIEGVPTSTTGFAGMTRTGPTSEVRLVTSFTEYESVYGGLEPLDLGQGEPRVNYMAHAARMFFANGGQRLYVSRVVGRPAGATGDPTAEATIPNTAFKWRARFAGSYGKVGVKTELVRRSQIGSAAKINGTNGTVVEIRKLTAKPKDHDPLGNVAMVSKEGNQPPKLVDASGSDVALATDEGAFIVDLRVTVISGDGSERGTSQVSASAESPRFIGRLFDPQNPEDENAIVTIEGIGKPTSPADVLKTLKDLVHPRIDLAIAAPAAGAGIDGAIATAADLLGQEADPDDPAKPATGLEALGEIDDIAIVALPDAADLDEAQRRTATDGLLAHAERLRYRIAVVDGPKNASLNQIRNFRGGFDSKYGAIYHPWIEIVDPLDRPSQGAPPKRLLVPPSGAVCGIYARNDVNRGVHKAPANEVVNGLTKFEININTRRQQVLNPEGVNALRFFPGRGNRVWGARTMSSDSEWKYVNVRRLFIFLEHSIDKGSQYAVFEPNNELLWRNIRQSVEDFLLVQWKNGALLGTKPEEAFFVRCDRTTMTQNDLDNGRLIVLVGVAPVMPAEFVIFRIGQFTASAKN